ncbi:MAG: glutamate 5-kinase [Candidatus Omnitrophota bacterium]
MDRKKLIKKNIKKVVVKIGTALLTTDTLHVNKKQIAEISAQIAVLREKGFDVILITSGAIVSGMSKLKLTKRPSDLPFLQSCAAIGQSQLMKVYDEHFAKHNIVTAQILLTADDLSQRKRYLNARNTILTLLKHEVVPIINENDTVSVEEIKFGDNDRLAALTANLIEADMLILLSDVEGFCNIDKENKVGNRLKIVDKITALHKQMACGPGQHGTGGMATKVEAAKIAADSGIYTVIANGRKTGVLLEILEKKDTGTLFLPANDKLAARKKWIAFGIKPKGTITIDNGAKEALIHQGKSLLPAGIKNIRGDFKYGDSIILAGENDREFARGIISYSSDELEKIKGKKTSEIEKILGYKYYDEVVHRNNLVLLDREE